jgi:Epidermal growth factor receptor transmembrane-juxtamembrane segment
VVHSSNNHAGPIAGGVVGGLAGLALIALALFFLMRRRQTKGGTPSASTAQAKVTDYSSSEVTSGGLHPGGYWGQQPPDHVPAVYELSSSPPPSVPLAPY